MSILDLFLSNFIKWQIIFQAHAGLMRTSDGWIPDKDGGYCI
jgi:hypothetical protein